MSESKIGWSFDNTYSKLSNSMFTRISPTPVKDPTLVIFNEELSGDLNLDFSNINDREKALIFSGNKLPRGSETIAQAYAGHQFGHFTILGDGRALIVGEHIDAKKKSHDIPYKGAGKTPYSRNAHGRAAVGPMLREYLISEAMHHLRIPTTRSLAVVTTGEKVIREKDLKGAILTRVASSHLRVGTFQYALITKNKNDLKNLCDYTIDRHYPFLKEKKLPAAELLKIVMEKQIDLIINWMRVGFVHGVMNTDNMTVSGETIDYGPCAFMDEYDPGTVFSSIDHYGRYAYFNQPRVAKWNLERFAESLIPLIHKENKKAIEIVTEIINDFPNQYKKKWMNMMKSKLGLIGENDDDEKIIIELLSWMHQKKADYTNTFCYLMGELKIEDDNYQDEEFLYWEKKWKNHLLLNNNNFEKSLKIMKNFNPLLIPRNQIIEKLLKEADENNFMSIKKYSEILSKPYVANSELREFQQPPKDGTSKYVTYCGT